MSEEIKIGDEVVFNKHEDAAKFEVVSISHDGYSLGVRSSRKLNEKIQYIDISFATRTGNTYDHTSLLDILSVPKPKLK